MFKYLFVVLMFMAAGSNASGFVAQKDGKVEAVFLGSNSDYISLMSIIIDGKEVDPFNGLHSGNNVGKYVNFGNANAGDEIVFTLDVASTGNKFYSDNARNSDGIEHVFSSPFQLPDGRRAVLVTFEDTRNGGDMDFDDSMAIFINVIPVED